MSQKNFCDECGSEIGCLRGNDYSETRFIIPYGPKYKYEVSAVIRAANSSGPADLCDNCTRTIIFDAVADRDKRRN